MSQFVFGAPSTPDFQFLGGTTCVTCGRFVEYRPCKTSTNGNLGRPVAVCHFVNQDGRVCNFIQWQPGSSRMSSPLSGTQALTQPIPSSSGPLPLPPLPSRPLVIAKGEICRALGCKSGRIRKDCRRRMCKKHCREAGGCLDPPHFVSNDTACQDPTPRESLISAAPRLVSPPPPAIPFNSATLMPAQSLPLQPTPSQPAPSTPHRAYASHMTPIFTQQMAVEQELQAKRRKSEAAYTENARKAKHTVVVYAWTEEDMDPNIIKFQAGFTWPHFEISSTVLEKLAMPPLPANQQIKLFDLQLGIWTSIFLPHIVTVSEQMFNIFLKPSDLRNTKDLPLYARFPMQPVPHMRTNFAGERAYIKQRMMHHELQQISTPTKLRPQQSRVSVAATRVRTTKRTKRTFIELSSDGSDDEVQHSGISPIPFRLSVTARREQIKQEDLLSDPSTIASSSSSSLTLANSSSSGITLASSSSQSTSAGLMYKPKSWPADFYAIDIIQCFKDVDNRAQDKLTKDIFERQFSTRFKSSTFYDHRGRWDGASLEAKQHALDAGRTADGLWSRFMAANPAPQAELKAARKALTQQPPSSILDLTISDSDD